MARAKLTAAQKNEIFDRAIYEGASDAQLAEEYGVSRGAISRVTHDKKRIDGLSGELEAMRSLALLKAAAHADRAVQKQIELMEREVPSNMLYINQSAAVDIMNRAGIKKSAQESGEVRVVFEKGGVAVNMPPSDDAD